MERHDALQNPTFFGIERRATLNHALRFLLLLRVPPVSNRGVVSCHLRNQHGAL